MVIAHVTEYTNVSNDDREAADLSRKEIYTRVREKLLADINKVQADSAMSSNAYLSLVQQGLKELDQMELKPDGGNNYSMVVLIPKTYYDMGKLIEADMSKPLTDWYNKQTAYTPPTFDELEKNIRSYIGYMREAEFVNERDRQKIETIVTSDIRLFKSLSDSATLARTAIESLKKLEQLAGDTEDRETFASFYCELAHNKGFSIGEQVNEWMYGLPDKELEEEAARRMPWER